MCHWVVRQRPVWRSVRNQRLPPGKLPRDWRPSGRRITVRGSSRAVLVGAVLPGVGGRVVELLEDAGDQLDRPGQVAAQARGGRPQLDPLPGGVGLPADRHLDLEPLEGGDGDQRGRHPALGAGRAGDVQPPLAGAGEEAGHGHRRRQRRHQDQGGGTGQPAGPVGAAVPLEAVERAGLGGPAGGDPVEGLPQPVLDHCWFPLISSMAGEPSSPRSRASPRWASDLTVPRGRPSRRATSASGRSSW